MLVDLRAHIVDKCVSQLVRAKASQGVYLMASCESLRAFIKRYESCKNYGLIVERSSNPIKFCPKSESYLFPLCSRLTMESVFQNVTSPISGRWIVTQTSAMIRKLKLNIAV